MAQIIAILQFVYRFAKGPLEKFQETSECPDCQGRRLNPTALAVLFHGKDIHSLSETSLEEAIRFFDSIDLNEREEKLAEIFSGKSGTVYVSSTMWESVTSISTVLPQHFPVAKPSVSVWLPSWCRAAGSFVCIG